MLGSLADFNTTGLMNQRATESAPVIEAPRDHGEAHQERHGAGKHRRGNPRRA